LEFRLQPASHGDFPGHDRLKAELQRFHDAL
jgi:hypothetical protein